MSNVDVMKGKKRSLALKKRCVDWTKCFHCAGGSTKKNPLRHSKKGAESFAANILRHWKAGRLDFDIGEEVEFVNGEPDFLTVFLEKEVKYHHDCTAIYRSKIPKSCDENASISTPEKCKTRSKAKPLPFKGCFCAFCAKYDDLKNMHAAGSFHAEKNKVNCDHNKILTKKWLEMALVVENENILKCLAAGDLAANAIWYHASCYKKFCNDYHRKLKLLELEKTSSGVNRIIAKDLAMDKVVQYIMETEASQPGTSFLVAELEELYLKELQNHEIMRKSNITNFTVMLLDKVDGLEVIRHSNKSRVVFKDTVQQAVTTFIDLPDELEQMMHKVSSAIRADIFAQKNCFTGQVNDDTQSKSVPSSLLRLVGMLVDGNKWQSEPSQETFTISETITYNARKQLQNHSMTYYKDKGRETPVMIYTTFKIYATVRSRSLIDHFFNVGLAVPYKRLLEITKQLHEDMMASFQTHKAFIANQLREGVYTVLIKDNIDLDGTSTFVTTHYHGTSITILQFPSL